MLTFVVPPGLDAEACACGGFAADSPVVPIEETALIEIGDGTEVITLRMGLEPAAGANAPSNVAFAMPVPTKAEFALADQDVFDDLYKLTYPHVHEILSDTGIEIWNPFADDAGAGSGAEPGEAEVLAEVSIGPYDVVQLTGESIEPVEQWLGTHGFALDPELGSGLGAYLAEGWTVVAVKLTSDPATGTDLAGALPPMRISFATDDPVYPMRLSAAAEVTQDVRLYVLADHRYDAGPAGIGLESSSTLVFADQVDSSDIAHYPALDDIITEPRFLTRYDVHISEPTTITADIALTQSASDDAYREVITTTVFRQSTSSYVVSLVLSVLIWLVLPLAVATGTVLLVRRRRNAASDLSGT